MLILSLQLCPCESAIKSAVKKLHQETDKRNKNKTVNADDSNQDQNFVVKFGALGCFDAENLLIFENYHFASLSKSKIEAEDKWFTTLSSNYSSNASVTIVNIQRVKKVLWENNHDFNVTKLDDMDIKVSYLMSLCSERYLNDQIVDALIYVYWKASVLKDETLCLTSYACAMLQNSMLGDMKDKNSLEKLLKGRLPSPDIKQVLIPVHVSNCHWALAPIHLPTKSFRFDDSLKWLPPGDLIARLRHLIDLLSELLPDNVHLTSRSWKRGTLRLERFGMPVQSSVAGTEGSASCGIL